MRLPLQHEHLIEVGRTAGGILLLGILAKAGGFVGGIVGGMMLVFGGMVVWGAIAPERAQRAAHWMAASVGFLGRWMALCFVPALVVIGNDVGGWVWVQLAVGAGIGCVVTLISTALGLTLLGGDRVKPGPRPAKKNADPVAMSWGWLLFWVGVLGVGVASGWAGLGWFGGSVAAYGGSERLRLSLGRLLVGGLRRVLVGGLHPLLVASGVLWWVRRVLAVESGDYLTGSLWNFGAGDVLMWGLGPGLASLGMLLFERRSVLREKAGALLVVLGFSAVGSVFMGALLAVILGMHGAQGLALIPRSVTSPIAIPMAERLGGSVGLTVAGVMVSGVLGAVIGRPLLEALGIKGAFVQGVSVGACAHGLGTVSLLEDAPEAAAYAGVAFALMGLISATLIELPFLRSWLVAWIG